VSELFSEVDEELRREQLKKIWDRYSGLIIIGALLVVGAVGGWRGYQYLEAEKAAKFGNAFQEAVALADEHKPAEAEAAFNKIAADGTSGYRALARLRAAAEAGKRDPQAAVKLYDGIAADTSLDVAERDVAHIRAAGLLVDTMPYAELRPRLEPLAVNGRTFRHAARELLSLSAFRSNDMTAARQWIDQIMSDASSPPGLRARAEALQALLPPAAKS